MQERIYIAGVDEVGMGPVAGPVVAAAVIFLDRIPKAVLKVLDDSKKMKAGLRYQVFMSLYQLPQVRISVAAASVKEIFTVNIRKAAMLAMQRAVARLIPVPNLVLVDGTVHPDFPCFVQPVIKGDGLSYSIAAASIVAKVVRDRLMQRLARRWDCYGWERNAGYPTGFHRTALEKHGPSPHHRQGFITVRQLSFRMDRINEQKVERSQDL